MSQDKNDLLFGAIEAGGTKMICAILDKNAKIIKLFYILLKYVSR